MANYSSVIMRPPPLVCLTAHLTATEDGGVMTWTTDDGTLSVSGQRIVLTDHDATTGFLRGALPGFTWAHVRSVLVEPTFAASETTRLEALDSDLKETDRYWTEGIQTGDVSTGATETARKVDMVIPIKGILSATFTTALTLNDDIQISAWGHVYTDL